MKKTFAYHKPSAEGLEKTTKLRETFSALSELVEVLAPASRERAIALTKIEEAAMWSIKAVVFNDDKSEVGVQ